MDEKKIKILLIASQKGDKSSYQLFLKEVSDKIDKFLKLKIDNEQVRLDISQEILMGIHKSLNTFQHDRPVMPWVMSITRFKLMDYFRHHYKENQLENSDKQIDDIAGCSHTESFTFLNEVLKTLDTFPGNQAELIKLSKIQGLSIKEIGEELGLSQPAVKVGIHRAVKKLKELFNE